VEIEMSLSGMILLLSGATHEHHQRSHAAFADGVRQGLVAEGAIGLGKGEMKNQAYLASEKDWFRLYYTNTPCADQWVWVFLC
jgi:hypothetical protein